MLDVGLMAKGDVTEETSDMQEAVVEGFIEEDRDMLHGVRCMEMDAKNKK